MTTRRIASARIGMLRFALTACALIGLTSSAPAAARGEAQDNWARGNIVCCAGETVYGHDFDRAGNLFILTNRAGGRLTKYNRRFVEVAVAPVAQPFGQVRTDRQGNVYVGHGTSIERFDNDLVPDGSVAIPAPAFSVFDVLNDGGFAIGQGTLNIYTAAGTFVRTIGAACSNPLGSICFVTDLDVFPGGEIIVSDVRPTAQWLSLFRPDGTFIAATADARNGGGVTVMPGDNLLYRTFSLAVLRSKPGVGPAEITTIITSFLPFGGNGSNMRIRASPSGDLVIAGEDWTFPVVHLPPGFRSIGPRFGPSPLPDRTAIPQPRVVSIVRRPSSTIVDLTFVVDDEDDATVDARVLVFRDGEESLAKTVRMTAFADGTGSNIGPGTPTGVPRTVSWDAAADLGSGSPTVPVSFQLLARDGRGLLDLDFVAIPAGVPNAADPALIVGRTPLSVTQMLDAWFWLIASNDPGITFANGEVRANGGPLAGQLLASNRDTTAAGVQFMFDRLGVRVATAAEKQRAREASTPGFVNLFPARNGMPYLVIPTSVNQFGIDTGAVYDYFFVLP